MPGERRITKWLDASRASGLVGDNLRVTLRAAASIPPLGCLHDSMIVDKAKFVSAIGAFVGSIVLLIGIYLFVNRVVFLSHATSSSAPIVSVSHESVSKGKGSVLAYVPTVRVRDRAGRPLDLKVDSFSEEPVYHVGQQMRVSCNPQSGCIEDTFMSKWGGFLIVLLVALLFFSPLLAWKSEWWQPNGETTGLKLQRDE